MKKLFFIGLIILFIVSHSNFASSDGGGIKAPTSGGTGGIKAPTSGGTGGIKVPTSSGRSVSSGSSSSSGSIGSSGSSDNQSSSYYGGTVLDNQGNVISGPSEIVGDVRFKTTREQRKIIKELQKSLKLLPYGQHKTITLRDKSQMNTRGILDSFTEKNVIQYRKERGLSPGINVGKGPQNAKFIEQELRELLDYVKKELKRRDIELQK